MRRSAKSAFFSSLAALVVSLGVALAPAPARADYLGFADVSPSDWAAEQGYIAYVSSEGLMSGLGETSFGPAEPLSRAQVATVLWRVAGEPEPPEGAQRFPDCDYSEGSFYGRAVSWARAAGVVSGYEDGTFGPADPVTREQLATMLARHASGVAGLDASSDGSALAAMADAPSVTLWDGMAWAVDAGVLTGDMSTGEPLARPQASAQRDQAAKMFAVFHRDVLGEGGLPEPDFDAPTDVEYTSDVVDASVSEVDVRDDGMTVALEGSEADVQVGDIVMIDPTEELPFGSAVKVEEVSSSGGVTTVEGVVPEPAEVYDSVIINEEYDKEDLLAGGASLQSIELTDEGISIDEDLGVYGKVTGSLTINDFEGHAFVFVPPGLLAKYFGYVDVDFEADLTVDLDFSISALPSNLKKIRLGSPIPLPYCGVPGWGLNVVFYLNTDVSGHIIVTTDIQMSTSAHRDLIGDIDQTTKSSTRTFDSVSIAVDGKIGPSAVVALMLLDEPVFDVGAEFGAAAKVESTQHPGLTCGDAAIWLYGEAFAEFVGEMTDSAKVTATIFDEDNSPLEMGIHVENGELVPECTWDPGADEEPGEGSGSTDPDFDGIPEMEDEGWGTEPIWTTDEEGRATIAEPFYIEAGTRMVITTRDDHSASAMFGTEDDTLVIRKWQSHVDGASETDYLINDVMYPWSTLNGIATYTFDVLYGRVKVWSMTGYGRADNPDYMPPIIRFEKIETPEYPVATSVNSIELKVGETYEVSASSTLNQLLISEGCEAKDWWEIHWSAEDVDVLLVNKSDWDEAASTGTAIVEGRNPGITYLQARFGTTPSVNGRGFVRLIRVCVTE